jgi:acetyl-CoA carboxylase carboxyltransferase component
VVPASEAFAVNRAAMTAALEMLDRECAAVAAGGGSRQVQRHRARGKLLVRERIELLIDQDSAFLELSPLAAWGTEFAVGASVVTGIGVVAGCECVLIGHDPTVRGGTSNPYTWKKVLRALDIARENRLPLINLVESGGGDLGSQAESFVPAGRLFHDITALSAAGVPTVALVFGNSTAGGAYVPGMCDYAVLIRERSQVFLGGPPLVKMATGEEADAEQLGGAEMHTTMSGLGDYLAEDERDAIRIGREIVGHLGWRKAGRAPRPPIEEPVHDPEELLGVVSADARVPFDPREVIARTVDGSRFEEYKARYGTSLVTGWAAVHGYDVGLLANHHGVLYSEESQKACEFIQLCNQSEVPLIFLQNTTGYIVGTRYEQRGIIKDGAKMINAVTNSTVPHITINIGASYGAGSYGMCGRSYAPRFLFAWPNAKLAVMGPQQLAGVLSIVRREGAAARGVPFDEEADARDRRAVEEQIERESTALANTGRLHDDGIIDPRDTRTVLGICLSAVNSAEVRGAGRFGVFRM